MRDYTEDRTYFATAPVEEIGDRLAGKVSDYYSYLTSSALVDLWRRAFYSYYGLLEDTALSGFGIFAIGRIRQSGFEGEMASIKVNHLRNLVTHLLVLTTQQRPQLKCRAINSDSRSLAQSTLGDGLLDYYMKEKHFEKDFRDATETALLFGEGFIRLDWDAEKGRAYGTDANGKTMYEGDVTSKVYHPFDVVRDVTLPHNNHDWQIFHDCVNRYDLAVKHPFASEEILNISTDITSGKRYVDPTKIIPAAGVGTKQTDLIDVYHFLHKPTPSLPDGRFTIFLQDGTVLFDGPLSFKEMPVYRISASDLKGSPFGYTITFDLIGIQQMIDKLYSIICSNQLASGVQNYWQPPGNQLTKTQIAGGLNLLESVVKPEVLELLHTPKEVYEFIAKLEQVMETLSGVNAVNRGETPANLKSGNALAFVAAQAITFSSDLQNSYNLMLENAGTGLVHILQDFVTVEKQAVIAGKFNRPLLKFYTGQDLEAIDRVVVETTSAISKTPSGKMEIAQNLVAGGFIRNAREYITVVNTGNLEPLYESEMSEIILVKAENEDLRAYKEPIALITDDHKLHALEHRALLANPDARRDPKLIQLVTAHIAEHINMAMTLQVNNPALLAMMGEQPLPMGAPMQIGGPAQPGAGAPAGMPVDAQNPMAAEAANVQQPTMPNLPPNADENTQNAYAQMQSAM